MNRKHLPSLFIAISASLFGPAHAGPFADDLGKCLVRSTTEADKTTLVRWMFTMMALHPKVVGLAAVPEDVRQEATKGTAVLFQTLLTKTCNAEARQALKNEGPSTIEAAFTVLGQVAGRELFSDPNVVQGLARLTTQLDSAALKAALE